MSEKSEVLSIVESGLAKINLPPLMRPPVRDDNPNEALVLWGVQYYTYSVIAHVKTVLRGLVQLIEAPNIPTAFIVCRHLFEWTAHTCYVSRNTEAYVSQKDWRGAWHFHSRAMQGNRWARDYGLKYEPTAGTGDIPDSLSITSIISCYEEYQREQLGKGDAGDTYALLTEHSQPNSACFLPYCEYRGPQVRFVSPSPDASLLGEEPYLIELMMFLERLLGLGREQSVRPSIVATLKALVEGSKGGPQGSAG